jgi:hypothetical protein
VLDILQHNSQKKTHRSKITVNDRMQCEVLVENRERVQVEDIAVRVSTKLALQILSRSIGDKLSITPARLESVPVLEGSICKVPSIPRGII